MADGIDTNTSGNPWSITFHSGGGTALPATVIGKQNTGGIPYAFIPKRVVWIAGDSAVAGNKVILKDVPANSGTARVIWEATATGADYEPPQEFKAAKGDAYCVGLQVTQFDAGVLYIYL